MTIQQFAAKYGTEGPTMVVNRILSDLEEGKSISPDILWMTRSMMNDLRVALTNEIYNKEMLR